MNITHKRITQIPRTSNKCVIKCDTSKITEQDLKNLTNQMINDFLKQGYSEEEIAQYTFYRYVLKKSKAKR